MKNIDLKTVVWKEGEYFVAWCLNVGISSFGQSREEALASLQEALELYFEDTPLSTVSQVEHPEFIPLNFQHA